MMEIQGIRNHVDYEQLYSVMQYYENGEWLDIGERTPITKEQAIYMQSELPKLDEEIEEMEYALEVKKLARKLIAEELGL